MDIWVKNTRKWQNACFATLNDELIGTIEAVG
jgi:hypothetical protein